MSVSGQFMEIGPTDAENGQFETPAPAHSVSRGHTRNVKVWFDSVFNSRAGPSMQRLLITKSTKKDDDADEDGLEAEMESTHQYAVRPGVPFFLKYVLCPLIIGLQFVVFLEIYNKKKNQCTEYAEWSSEVKYGIGLAILFICAQICSQLFQGLQILLAGYYGRQPWAIILAVAMLTQFCFEIVVYSHVMALSVSTEDLIQNFVALAVANETDDKVGAYLKCHTAKKIMFLDKIEDDEQAELASEANQLRVDRQARNMLRSSACGANHWRFIIHHGHAWGVRLVLLAFTYLCVLSSVLVTWATPCSHGANVIQNSYTSYVLAPDYTSVVNATVLSALNGDYTSLQDFKVSGAFADAEESTIMVDFGEYGFSFPYASDYHWNPTAFSGVSITSNGLYQLEDAVRSPYDFPNEPPVSGAEIAPFFGNYKVDPSYGGAFYMFGTNNSTGTPHGLSISSATSSATKLTSVDEIVFILQRGVFDTPCAPELYGDGICDFENNISECNWDYGDCCENQCGTIAVADDIVTVSRVGYSFCPPDNTYCQGAASASFAPASRKYISYELILSSCGHVVINYPAEFDIPDGNRYTVGFQWLSEDDSLLTSNCHGVQCGLYYGLRQGSSIVLDASGGIPSGATNCGYYTNIGLAAGRGSTYGLDVQTFNVTFDQQKADLRANGLGQIVCGSDAPIIYESLNDGRCDDGNNSLASADLTAVIAASQHANQVLTNVDHLLSV